VVVNDRHNNKKNSREIPNNETHLLPRLAVRPKSPHRRDRDRPDRQNRIHPATVAPGQANEEYSKITPLKKLPVLILDNGDVILDPTSSSNILTNSPAAESGSPRPAPSAGR
jgi:glutathione S-transferase